MMQLRTLTTSGPVKPGPSPCQPTIYAAAEPLDRITQRGRTALTTGNCGRCGSPMLLSEYDVEAGLVIACLLCAWRGYP